MAPPPPPPPQEVRACCVGHLSKLPFQAALSGGVDQQSQSQAPQWDLPPQLVLVQHAKTPEDERASQCGWICLFCL